MSLNPSVTMAPTVAPMSGGASSARASASRSPSSTPCTRSPGMVSTLLVRQEPPRSTATSVNVPPMSTPTRYFSGDLFMNNRFIEIHIHSLTWMHDPRLRP